MEALVKIPKKINKETLKQILKKIILVIEFLMSIILAYSVYKIVIYKHYQNIWNLKYIISVAIAMIFVIASIIWNCKKGKFEKMIILYF